MRYEIVLAPEAVNDLKRLHARVRAEVKDALERHLRHEPAKVSKSRIKRLRGLSHPQYRLRVEEVRVFYDITEKVVEVLAIVPKSEAASWLKDMGD
ncbi:MAG: type II toxin-antitoxin system RelE/ParE family toxin [Candidatus Deferrimicrobiaceae bacterium]